jgi:hypothetical protein
MSARCYEEMNQPAQEYKYIPLIATMFNQGFVVCTSVESEYMSPHRFRYARLSILGRDIQIYGRHAAQIIAVQAARTHPART